MQIDIGRSLRAAQARDRVTGAELAQSFDTVPQQVQRWRQAKDLKVGLTMRLADYFGLTLGEFIGLGTHHERV